MSFCRYHILEYASSELQVEGTPIVLVLYVDGEVAEHLGAFIVKNWKTLIENCSQSDLSFIQCFLDDIAYYAQQDQEICKNYFDKLEHLSVGPIRQFASGMCTIDDVSEIVSLFFGASCAGITWLQILDRIEDRRLNN